ncbi:MAG: sigma 54-interacting transcriptional regulator [Labilithrix sp.]|nr:sigma 54-interacting transcriptional regulator [Labilithrix sp.]MCW5817747.1 sigma 54-interacting transcriptional regulator [Labilithrix sp.]
MDRTAALGRIALRMTRSLEPGEVLAEIVRALVGDLDAAMARVWLVAAEDVGVLSLVASAGLSERLDGSHARVAIGALKIGQIAAQRTPLSSSDVLADPRFVEKEWLRANGIVGFAGHPLLGSNGELLGVLAIFARRALAEEDLASIEILAAQASVAIANAKLYARVEELTRKLEAENAYLKAALHEPRGILGKSAAIQRALGEVRKVAPTTAAVLITGETGTGKELFARAVHEGSPRARAPLVRVSCAALPPTLIESELFGHEKGAFTGAVARRIGRFELAHGGTLFLDEVGELPLEAQAKLLRVLQEHEIDRVGGTRPIPVDVRIVAATNRDLAADVKAGRFRSDLYFRLAVFPLVVPPLRDRKDDIPLLAAAACPKPIDDDAMAYLEAYDWPGNVRELQNVLERAAILARDRVRLADLPELTTAPPPSTTAGDAPLKERVNAFERSILEDALRRADGNQSEAARLLRTSRATLQYRLKTLGMS